ncbi:MAG TPA: hypothetical protein P5572_04500 [Phycisphaerae bacterium]|nr:hypothetical protein [Phycisphaerae bacterium]
MSRYRVVPFALAAASLLLLMAILFAAVRTPARGEPRASDGQFGDPTPAAGAVAVTHGDCDLDGDVDLTDWACAADCLSGPDEPCASGCTAFDFDGDLDVDLADVRAFQEAFTGPLCFCDSDINGDGRLTTMDYAILVSPTCFNRPAAACPRADLNCSGFVDQQDVDIFWDCFNFPFACGCAVPPGPV